MMDQNDIKQIDTVFTKRLDERFALSDKKLNERFVAYDKKFDERFTANNKILVQEVVLQVGEFIQQNVLPQIDAIHRKLTTLPDRDFITRQNADLKAAMILHLRAQNDRFNLLVRFLRDQKILSDEQMQKLHELEMFPTLDGLLSSP